MRVALRARRQGLQRLLGLFQEAISLHPYVVRQLALRAGVPVRLCKRRTPSARALALLHGGTLFLPLPLWGEEVPEAFERVAVAVLEDAARRGVLERVVILIIFIPAVAEVRPRKFHLFAGVESAFARPSLKLNARLSSRSSLQEALCTACPYQACGKSSNSLRLARLCPTGKSRTSG
jgi:hypothetical protein